MTTTDFFDRQDHAHRQTVRLVVMFALSVIVIILAVYLVLAWAVVYAGPNVHHAGAARFVEAANGSPSSANLAPSLWQPVLFLWVVLGTVLVISLSSLYKISELSAGGEQIALDARRQGDQPANHRSGRTPAAERGRGNGLGLGHSRSAGLCARSRAVDQRFRRRPSAGRRRGGRLRRLPSVPHARGTARRDGPRVQPHPQRRHAAEPPPDRHRLRHPRPGHPRLLSLAVRGLRFLRTE